jgi:hypothetical protein
MFNVYTRAENGRNIATPNGIGVRNSAGVRYWLEHM